MKEVPGPRPASCITCRQRKKKCDKSYPICNRCNESGFRCLGYGRIGSVASGGSSGLLFSGLPSPNRHAHPYTKPYNATTASSLLINDLTRLDHLELQLASQALSHFVPRPHTNDEEDVEDNEPSCTTSDIQSLSSVVQGVQDYREALFYTHKGRSLPPRFTPNPQISGKAITFILSEYELLLQCMFFRANPAHMQSVRAGFASRIMSSEVIRWSSFVGAQMFNALRRDPDRTTIQRYIPCLDRLDELCLAPKQDVNLDGLNECLSGALELIFLRFISSNVKSGYNLLRRTAPIFMQVACADPTLWPRDPRSNGISLAHALLPPRYQLGRFIFMDIIFSFAFGLPPLVEYDTSHPVIETATTRPAEWVHGCPTQFMFSIMRISQWKAYRFGEDSPWREIEADTWAWRPVSLCDRESDAGGHVVRVAVQEGWRHALLIYLYMGMCGVNSHDPRVQSSVRQISRLYGVINSRATGEMHLTAPFLLAAVCTRSEADRAKFRKLISQPVNNRMWILKSINFGGLLDHLWQGVAANGGPVTWEDYVNSRRAVIDLGL